MRRFSTLNKGFYFVMLALCFARCNSDSCTGQRPTAEVKSTSYSNKVWVTFYNNSTKQTFQVQNITADSPKATPPLTTGSYDVVAQVYASSGTRELRASVEVKNCIDYSVVVNSVPPSLSLYISGKPR